MHGILNFFKKGYKTNIIFLIITQLLKTLVKGTKIESI
jgi:hypothetical protein